MKNFHQTFILSVTALAVLSSCASYVNEHAVQLSPAKPAALAGCGQLAQFNFANTAITSAVELKAGEAKLGALEMPAHCLVKGAMFKRKGSDGKEYEIGFEMRLPNNWNGRFYHQVNGGLDGVVQPAYGALGGGPATGALHQGFAVISSDAGHKGNQNPTFGAEYQARLDYGFEAVAKLTPMAKGLIQSAYGKAPDRSYIGGCSNGGRHAMVALSRSVNDYDGFLIGAPGYRLPNAALAQLWAGPAWKNLATAGAEVNHPFIPNQKITDLNTGFTAQERRTVADAVLAQCDALDGAKDGLVQDVAACQAAFNLARDVPTCGAAGRTGSCLTAAQKAALSAAQAGGKTSKGESIYAAFPYDSGIAAANWAQWKFVNSQTLDPGLGYVFVTPTRPIKPFEVDVDSAFQGIYASNETFKLSADAIISAPSKDQPEDLRALQKRGAKALLYHGVSDAIFSELDTRAWVDKANKALGNNAPDTVRYFPVPGMAHCSGGFATDQFNALTPLVQWVEQGIAPQSITATARGAGNVGGVNAELPKDWAAARTRPLCPYPQVATYKGSGSLDDAANFVCK